MNDFDEYYEAAEPGRRERAFGWATAIGLQQVASFMVEKSLEKHFERELAFKYKGISDDAFVCHFAAFVSRLWQIHPFREGNTRTTALMAIKYLRSMRYEVTNDLFAKKSYYFRNALVRANYDNRQLDVEKTLVPLEEFFKVLIFGEELELHSRFLKLGQEYGSPAATAIANLHRQDIRVDDGVNDGVKLTPSEEVAVKAILRNPHLTAPELATILGTKPRQAERIRAALKKKAGLRHRGPDKTGEWYFEGVKEV